MEIQEFEKQLKKIKFFDGYTESAKELALNTIRENHAEGMSGDLREYFEKYPGLALRFYEMDGELDGPGDLKLVVKQMGDSSFGMFVPKKIKAQDDTETMRLEFSIEGVVHSVECEHSGWMPEEILECLFNAMKEHCNTNYLNSIFYPYYGQSANYTWCSDRAMKALRKNKLVPAEYNDVPDGF
jgi:hypothetical protein